MIEPTNNNMLHSGWHGRMIMLMLLLLTSLTIYSQGIAVEKFEAAPEDLTANLQGTQVLDQNGDVCALIRIQTTQKGFVFDVGVLGITKTDDNKVGEIWVYVPKGVKRITIRHPQLGSLVNYPFPIEIQGARTYRMYLTTGQVHTIIEQDDGMTYFALNVTPAKAVVMIDGVLQPLDDDGALSLRLARGSHTLAIQAPGYDAYSTTFDLGKERMAKEVALVSALAQLTLNCSTPGVGLYVNDQFKANGSWNGELMPGVYLLEARKEGHYTQKQSVTLAAKEKKTIDLPALTARTGNLDVNYKPINCEVYLDGTRLGVSPDMFKNIIMGKHKIKISKAGYTTKEVTIDISEGQTATLTGTLDKMVAQNNANQGGGNGIGGSSSVFDGKNKTFTVKGVTFTMVAVEGGTFMMGATSEQVSDAYDSEKPVHKVTLSSYYIGQTEVTQALWEAVMGNNPSRFKGDNKPVTNVNWDDCQDFVIKLNQLTGKRFRLPTEAEWEYACRGGKKSRGFKYSGSNTIDDVAWYGVNSSHEIHPVATKSPNELGLYDMSGNVYEWCLDWYGSYSNAAQTNPIGASSGSVRVRRSGSWDHGAGRCRSSFRSDYSPGYRYENLGLRLVLSECSLEKVVALNYPNQGGGNGIGGSSSAFDGNNKTFTVKGVTFTMVAVEGGTFMMGATSEQGSDASSIEESVHQVTLSSYYIGQTEVTQALWKAVMGNNPSYYKEDNKPVEEVSWDDCQDFVIKLNQLTGKRFRLPTEAEWEYACRGGKKSREYKYSGSNTIDDVAWYKSNSKRKTHPVATKSPNELGIYDMSGNVYEWCQDWYGSYSSAAQTNPTGASSGSVRVHRGGGWFNYAKFCRSSDRNGYLPDYRSSNLGLRLVLSE